PAPPAGAASSTGLDAGTINAMREMDALCHVVRAFPDAGGDAPKPLDEIHGLEVEMNLADLILIEKRIDRLKKERSKPQEVALLEKLKAHLDEGKPLREMSLPDADWATFSGFRFLSQKPLLLVYNAEE